MGLGNTIYLWSFKTNCVEKLAQFEEYNLLTGLAWDKLSETLALGALNGAVEIWDVNFKKKLVSYEDHCDRVGTVSLFG